MDYRIAIPSIKRANTIKDKTINYLAKTDIDFSKVDLFLSDGNELPEYKKSLADYPINFIVTNQKHVNTQRNFIVNYYKENQLVLGIDDDIKNIEMKIDDKKTTTLLKLNEFINNAFEICLSKKVDMWGVNPVLNPYFLKNTVSFNLKYIVHLDLPYHLPHHHLHPLHHHTHLHLHLHFLVILLIDFYTLDMKIHYVQHFVENN